MLPFSFERLAAAASSLGVCVILPFRNRFVRLRNAKPLSGLAIRVGPLLNELLLLPAAPSLTGAVDADDDDDEINECRSFELRSISFGLPFMWLLSPLLLSPFALLLLFKHSLYKLDIDGIVCEMAAHVDVDVAIGIDVFAVAKTPSCTDDEM